MFEFVKAAASHELLRNALIVGLLASIACGVVGSYVVTKRITYLAGGISHFVLGGMGLARYLGVKYGLEGLHPLHGAVGAAVLAAFILGHVSIKTRQREDTVIGALWATGMAVGILFITMTPGYNTNLMSYLFGNILMVSERDLWLIVILDAVIVALGILFYNQLLAISFDEEFARLRGLNVETYYLILLVITALTIVLLVTVVGIVMTIALLTLPAAVAGHFSKSLWQMMVMATVLCMVFTTGGLAASYGPDLPSGAMIVIIAGAVYLLTVLGNAVLKRRRRLRKAARPAGL
ncbi:MAG: metal ABC transporter permease [Planctomycetes bacterium]|nr:metal ABC transporter permease [Planctomycetota bacterium]